MIEDVFVIDATVHGSNFQTSNLVHPAMPGFVRSMYTWATDYLQPQDDPRYRLTFDEWQGMFQKQPELLQEVLFGESPIDAAMYQAVPLYCFFGDGSSPLWPADKIRERFPHRMFTYGGVTPRQSDWQARIDQYVDHHHVLGLKLYPVDIFEGETQTVRLDDEERLFPIIAHAQDRGLKVIAVHKALRLGPTSIDLYDVDDVAPAARAFPEMTFEIVHGGLAYVRETAALLERYENITVNLEGTPCLALNCADKFADAMAPLLASGAHERIFFATGTPIMHPAPFVEAFWRFEMPRGYPPMTWEMKRGMLGENFARQHNWDIPAMKLLCAQDSYGQQAVRSEPWSVLRRSDKSSS